MVMGDRIPGPAKLESFAQLTLGSIKVISAEGSYSQVEMAGSLRAVHRNRLCQLIESLNELLLLSQDNSQVEPWIESLGVDVDGCAKFVGGVLEFSQGQVLNAEVIVSHQKRRVDLDRFLVMFDGFLSH